jgi:cell shape-determining protein MreC
LVVLFYFRVGIWGGFSYASESIFHPILVLGNSVGEKLKGLGTYFVSKNYLYNQNQKLQAEVDFNNARNSNYDSVVADNASLQEILNRKDPKAVMILAAILSKPNQSLYDTLLIDAGTANGIKVGKTVFALGDVPIGRVSDVYPSSAKVVLYSSPGESTQAVISSSVPGGDVFSEIIGRGGGNFEMIMPKDFIPKAGGQVVLPGINPHVLAIIQKVISDPRNPFTKVLLVSPVNIQELKFVEVEQ